MKNIFEPGDFQKSAWGLAREILVTDKQAAELANAKLTSLGIDAETPEKLKRYEWRIDKMQKTMEELKASLNSSAYLLDRTRLERDKSEERVAELKRSVDSWKREEANWIAQEMELKNRLSELEHQKSNDNGMLHLLSGKISELERMIAEAPMVYATPSDGSVTDIWETTYHDTRNATHRARLVQIEPIT